MSLLDAFDHSHIGYLFGIPLYRVMNTPTNAMDASEFQDHYCLGCGDDVHGMYVVANTNHIVESYLEWKLGIDFGTSNIVEYESRWTIEESFKAIGSIHRSMTDHGVESAEAMIIYAIGDMICRYAPELITEQRLKDAIHDLPDYLNLVEREYDDPYGKIVLNDGQLIWWGVSLEDELSYYETGTFNGGTDD